MLQLDSTLKLGENGRLQMVRKGCQALNLYLFARIRASQNGIYSLIVDSNRSEIIYRLAGQSFAGLPIELFPENNPDELSNDDKFNLKKTGNRIESIKEERNSG